MADKIDCQADTHERHRRNWQRICRMTGGLVGGINSISIITENGISGNVSAGPNAAIELFLGDITPSTVVTSGSITAGTNYFVGGSSGPRIKNSSGEVQFRTNDDSAFTTIRALDIYATGSLRTANDVILEAGSGRILLGNSVSSAGNFLQIPDGSNSAPPIQFSGETNTGIYRSGTNELAFTVNGTQRGKFTATGFVVSGTISATDLLSGTYTPTLTNVANLDASTAYVCQYMRVGNTVTVSGRVAVDPTTTLTTTQLGISLPIASNFANEEDCGGTAVSPSIANQCMAVHGDATNDRAEMIWKAVDVTNQSTFFTFTYRVI